MNAETSSGKRPKSWTELLKEASTRLSLKPRRVVGRLIKERDYLTACEIVKSQLGKEQYESMLTREYLEPKFTPAGVHDAIFKIDSRLVATPNIDKIYESHANHLAKGSIKVKQYHEDDVADAIRRSNRVVLKVHGSIDSPGKMIFTRREYAEARMRNSEFYAILHALVMTHTFIFLGCGGNDPDIKLVLEDYAFRFKHSRRHFMTFPKGSLSSEEAETMMDSMNIEFLEYSPHNQHRELIDSIEDLRVKVENKRSELAESMDW